MVYFMLAYLLLTSAVTAYMYASMSGRRNLPAVFFLSLFLSWMLVFVMIALGITMLLYVPSLIIGILPRFRKLRVSPSGKLVKMSVLPYRAL